MEQRTISAEEAIALLPDGKQIHTYRNPAGMLIGADHSRKSLIADIKKYEYTLELCGDLCRSMKHGLALADDVGYLFIETDEEKLNAFDPIETPNS